MARKKKGVGSVIRVRRISGVGQLTNPNTFVGAAMPVVIGGGVAAVTTMGLRQWMTPTTDLQMRIVENAPWVGIAAGGLTSLALWNMTSQAAGVASLTAAVTVGIGMLASEYAASMRAPLPAGNGTAGLRAVVPEYSMRGLPARGRGTGAIVMEPQASRGYGAGPLGAYGETVNLGGGRGTGAINTGAFGTPGFTIGG